MITNIINLAPGEVFYSDTDSVILDKNSFDWLRSCESPFVVDDQQFGALKNEYPLSGDSTRSSIK
jgi:hypothetical protein